MKKEIVKIVFGPFKFWKENRTDKEFKLKGSELLHKFEMWLPSKGRDFLEYYSSDRIIRIFLTDSAGINSTFMESQFPDMLELLKPAYLDYTYPAGSPANKPPRFFVSFSEAANAWAVFDREEKVEGNKHGCGIIWGTDHPDKAVVEESCLNLNKNGLPTVIEGIQKLNKQ